MQLTRLDFIQTTFFNGKEITLLLCTYRHKSYFQTCERNFFKKYPTTQAGRQWEKRKGLVTEDKLLRDTIGSLFRYF